MKIQLSEHFTYKKLLLFVLPSVVMMVFTSIYTVVDGLFVTNFVGKGPFTAINLMYPVLMILGAFGFMIGTGGTAIVSKTMGEGENEKANRYFSMLIYTTLILGGALAVIGFVLLPRLSELLGAKENTLKDCVLYGRIILIALPFFMLQNVFQSFFVSAEKPKLGLFVMIAAGCANIILDALFVAAFRFGLAGAAIATAVSQITGGIIPIVYFARKNNSRLRLVKAGFNAKILLKTCTNGSSELMTNVAASVVTILYNFQLLRFAGDDGVAAYGVIMYVAFIFSAIFFGYSIGSAPLVGYHYGAANRNELKNLFKKSLILTSIAGSAMLIVSFALSAPLAKLFVGYDQALYEMTTRGLKIYAFSFLLSGFNVFGSAFFTALNNGAVSAAISFLRTLIFQSASVLLLPLVLKLDGIWGAIILAEFLSGIVTIAFLVGMRKRYGYA